MGSNSDDPATATNFYGFGINSVTLRYQVPTTTNNHKFYRGSTLGLDVCGSRFIGTVNVRTLSAINFTATGTLITGMLTHLEPPALYPKKKLYITSPTWLTKPQEPDNEPL